MNAKSAIAAAALAGSFCLVGHGAPVHAVAFPSDNDAIVHVLNRIGFGSRPGDVERVRQIGLEHYIDQQLHPERVPDEAVQRRLGALETIRMTSREIAERYGRPLLEARRERPQMKPAAGRNADEAQPAPKPNAAGRRANQAIVELSEQKVLRAAYSERQLQEALVDFWFNHFNVDARKGADRFLLTEYEREVIRPHVLGSFRELLGATAKSPAMLFYLDNWMSASVTAAPGSMRRTGRHPGRRPGGNAPFANANAAQPKAPRGLNENYGRELMELQTLGVDGGYTEKDVTEVARAFTGWTIERPRQGGSFMFDARRHDRGEKLVLGHRIKAGGGIEDGEQVLDLLAAHPSTARFIAMKLVQRFVSDTPPPALVDRAAARFRETHGDLREVTRTILTSQEFLSADAFGAKVKTPFEFIVSAVRASGAEVADATPLVRAAQQLGMPLYQCQPPTGYQDTADAWVNTGALVNRMNLAVQLAGNRLPGVSVPGGDADALATRLGGPEFQRK